MNRQKQIFSLLSLTLLTTIAPLHAGETSQQTIHNSGTSSGAALVDMSRGSTQFSAGVSSIPLQLSGGMGQFSQAAGDTLYNYAADKKSGPLPITDEVITIGPPPNKAIREE
jgi:hypothetical protein